MPRISFAVSLFSPPFSLMQLSLFLCSFFFLSRLSFYPLFTLISIFFSLFSSSTSPSSSPPTLLYSPFLLLLFPLTVSPFLYSVHLSLSLFHFLLFFTSPSFYYPFSLFTFISPIFFSVSPLSLSSSSLFFLLFSFSLHLLLVYSVLYFYCYSPPFSLTIASLSMSFSLSLLFSSLTLH